jgi:hypothetical protein
MLCVEAANPLMPLNRGMPDLAIVYIWRENITRSEIFGAPKPSFRSWRITSPSSFGTDSLMEIGVMPLPMRRDAMLSGESPSRRPLDNSPLRERPVYAKTGMTTL